VTARVYPTIARPRWDAERASTAGLWLLVAFLAFLALNLALRSRGILPDYDALFYIGEAFRLHLGLTGTYVEPGRIAWLGLGYTNSLDRLLIALMWNLVDVNVAVWIVHTAYFALFAFLLRRLLGAPTALVVTAFTVSQAYFLHQYTHFISEMKVGLFLALFVAYLFHPDASRHRAALFWITVLLVLLRTINVLFVGPICVAFVALRWLDRERRREIVPILVPVVLALVVLSPLLYVEIPNLLYYVRATSTGTRQNWIDMTGIHDKKELAIAYLGGVRGYNRPLSWAAIAAACAAVFVAFTRKRARLAMVRDAAVASAIVFAVLMQATTTNDQVMFWLFALEALLAGLVLRAIAPPVVIAAAGGLLCAYACVHEYRNFASSYWQIDYDAPINRMQRELTRALQPFHRPQIYQNFGGIGPLDARGVEIPLGRVVGWPHGDQVRYMEGLQPYLDSLAQGNVAFIANRNFIWPDYIGVNRHTEEISRYLDGHAAELGLVRTERILFDGDPDRYIDVYRRATVDVELKWAQFGDHWLDLDTRVKLDIPGDKPVTPGTRLEVRLMLPQAASDPAFRPPVKAVLRDASGRSVADGEVGAFGENVLRLPIGGLVSGNYTLVFDKSFSSADPRKLVAVFESASIVPSQAR